MLKTELAMAKASKNKELSFESDSDEKNEHFRTLRSSSRSTKIDAKRNGIN